MSVQRSVPNLQSADIEAVRAFYVHDVGFDVSMDEGEFILFSSRANPDVQVSLNETPSGPQAALAVDVGTPERVAELYEACQSRGLSIVEPLDDKPWGIRRFGVVDPSGAQVTLLAHL